MSEKKRTDEKNITKKIPEIICVGFVKQLLYYLGLFATLYHGMKICEFIICQWKKIYVLCTTKCNMLSHFFQIKTVIKAQNYSTVG